MSTPPRLPAECYEGYGRYFLTMCTDRRCRSFSATNRVDVVECELLRTLKDYRFDAIAYCFMPDHMHALIESTADECNCTKFVSMFKQRSGFAHKRATDEYLWQDGYFDRVLRRDEATLDVIAYILQNPVRAGLCDDSRRYPFCGSSKYSIDDLHEAVAARAREVGRRVVWRP